MSWCPIYGGRWGVGTLCLESLVIPLLATAMRCAPQAVRPDISRLRHVRRGLLRDATTSVRALPVGDHNCIASGPVHRGREHGRMPDARILFARHYNARPFNMRDARHMCAMRAHSAPRGERAPPRPQPRRPVRSPHRAAPRSQTATVALRILTVRRICLARMVQFRLSASEAGSARSQVAAIARPGNMVLSRPSATTFAPLARA